MQAVWVFVLMMSVPGCAEKFHEEEPAPFGLGPHCPPHSPVVVEPSGVAHQYVVDSIQLPTTPLEAQMLGFDIDCDENNRPDNALGQILSTITSQGDYDLNYESKLLVDAGKILHLIQVKTRSFENANGVGFVILHGDDTDGDPSDNFSGQEPFAINESRGEGVSSGRFRDGLLTAEYGTDPIAVTFPGLEEPFVLGLVGARIELEQTEDGLAGRISGGITNEEVDSALIPILQEGLSRIIDRDCNGFDCAAGSLGEWLLELFDDCSEGSLTCDGELAVEELRTNDLVSSFLSPDLDLFDETGAYEPRTDEIKDSLSFGVGFTAVPATFATQ